MRSRPTEAEWLATLTKNYGEAKAKQLADGLKKLHPEKSSQTLSYMCGGPGLNALSMRNNVVKMATLKTNLKAAPAFTWYFSWQSPMLEGAGAWHTAELAFCFDNTKLAEQGRVTDRRRRRWQRRWPRPGQPSPRRQPQSARIGLVSVRPAKGGAMVFDNNCRMEADPEGEVRKILLT